MRIYIDRERERERGRERAFRETPILLLCVGAGTFGIWRMYRVWGFRVCGGRGGKGR